jgi:cytochrome P450
MSVSRKAPGPRGAFLLGNLPAFERDPLKFVTDCAREHGDVVAMRFAGVPAFFLNHPDHVEAVLATNHRKFVKPMALKMSFFARLVGLGLITSEDEFWLKQRRLIQPAFHRERIKTYGEVTTGYAARMLESWRDGDVRDVHEDMMQLMMQIVARSLFGADITGDAADIGQALRVIGEPFVSQLTQTLEWLLLIVARSESPLAPSAAVKRLLKTGLPTPSNRRFHVALEQLDRIIERLIREHRESGSDSGDLLSMLLQAQDEDGTRMSDRQIRDEAITLFIAGHETTAIAMSWTWYLLALHPEAEAKLHAELEEVLGGRTPTAADIPSLRFTEMVIKESMRLYPPLWGQAREAREDCEVGGYRVPAGAQVFMFQWVIQRDSRFFERPDEFVPERWDGDAAKRLPKFAYFPFGGGPRVCIGNGYAMLQTMLLVAETAQRFRLRLDPSHPVGLVPTITLRPRDGIKVILQKR